MICKLIQSAARTVSGTIHSVTAGFRQKSDIKDDSDCLTINVDGFHQPNHIRIPSQRDTAQFCISDLPGC